jgi:predicted deacylase
MPTSVNSAQRSALSGWRPVLFCALGALLPAFAAPLEVVTLDSGRPGPIVLVVGGMHGNEPSGALAAAALAKDAVPRNGKLLVLPEANPEALKAGERSAPRIGSHDLNRIFPGSEQDEETRRAAAIFALAQKADLVLDLHEEGSAWLEADLPTLVVSPATSAFTMDLLEALNRQGIRFAFTGGAPAGSLVGELGTLDRKALVVEVPARLPEAERVRMHRLVVEVALGLLGMR